LHQLEKKGNVFRRQSYRALHNPDADSCLATASPCGDTIYERSRLLSTTLPPIPMQKHKLPDYLEPLPNRISPVDIDFLYTTGALSLPDIPIRNALLQSYVEYVHPYMPLLELHGFLHIVNEGTGTSGRISLLLFQAVMFAGTAFLDMDFLISAGYTSRKSARKAFFRKARVRCIISLGHRGIY
jgi:hypothetical protein